MNTEEEHHGLPQGVMLNNPDQEKLKPTFTNTTLIINKHKSLQGWEEIYRNFKANNFPDIIPLSQPEKRNYNDKVYINIKISQLPLIVARSTIFYCSGVIEWITNHSDTKARQIKDSTSQVITNF